MKKFLFFLFISFVSAGSLWAQDQTPKVDLDLVADTASIQPGTPITVGIYLTIEEGWHTYYKEPGEAGAPPQFNWTLPDGFKIGPLSWPEPLLLIEPGDIRVNAYKKDVLIWTQLMPPEQIEVSQVVIGLKANWLVCEELCIPESGTAELVLPVQDQKPLPANTALFDRFRQSRPISSASNLPKFLLFAFIGGIILNVMPCVLPVISLKILSFVQNAKENRKRIALLGLSFSAGVLVSFLALAIMVVSLKFLGKEVGWGFQFQYPEFVVILTSIVFVLGLSLAGVFELSLKVPQKGVALTRKEGMGGAFFHGVLATILATPCTAPFVGVTIGFAFTSTALNIFLIFIFMGLGLAFPFLLLSLNPAWTRLIPKPGVWMEVFKEVMAFLLFATVIWLVWLVGRQLGNEGIVWILAFLLILAFASWAWGKVQFGSIRQRVKVGLFIFAIIFLGHITFLKPLLNMEVQTGETFEQSEGIQWEKYHPEKLQQYLAEGRKVFLDFTADWCLTCKVNEKRVLKHPDVIDLFRQQQIVPIKLDWTFQQSEVTALLKRFNRFGVPLYVYYPEGNQSDPVLLPEVLSVTGTIETLKK